MEKRGNLVVSGQHIEKPPIRTLSKVDVEHTISIPKEYGFPSIG